jgi:hypothetical protein
MAKSHRQVRKTSRRRKWRRRQMASMLIRPLSDWNWNSLYYRSLYNVTTRRRPREPIQSCSLAPFLLPPRPCVCASPMSGLRKSEIKHVTKFSDIKLLGLVHGGLSFRVSQMQYRYCGISHPMLGLQCICTTLPTCEGCVMVIVRNVKTWSTIFSSRVVNKEMEMKQKEMMDRKYSAHNQISILNS